MSDSLNASVIAPTSFEELKSVVAGHDMVLPVGNQTKPTLSRCERATLVSLRELSGILEYEPSEFTFTAQAGTPISEINRVLDERNQYLPFDPMLVDAGATIGGTVGSGLSGSGRFRYGGVRDFLLGVRFLSGDGEVIRAGGKVVKNAAGFDIPKFLVGSMGRFGVIAELSFKVFPKQPATRTLNVQCDSHESAIERMSAAAASRWEIDAMDYQPSDRVVAIRIAGPEPVNDAIASDILSKWGQDASELDSPNAYWNSTRELNWSATPRPYAVKVPATAEQLRGLCEWSEATGVADLRFTVAGGVAWVLLESNERLRSLDDHLQTHQMNGLVLRGDSVAPHVGHWVETEMASGVKRAMDPSGKFPVFFEGRC